MHERQTDDDNKRKIGVPDTGYKIHPMMRGWTTAFAAAASNSGIVSPSSSNNHQGNPLIPPPPSLSVPVWSLATPAETAAAAAAPQLPTSKNNNHNEDDTQERLLLSSSSSSASSRPLSTSMNIVTFATPVSVAPLPKRWIVSLYHGTRTKDFFCHCRQGVLQLLRPRQQDLVPILGKRSGYEEGYSKSVECAKLGMPWVDASFNNAAGELSSSSSFFWTRDHVDESFSSSSSSSSSSLPYTQFHLLPDCALYLHLQICEDDNNNTGGSSFSFLEAGDHIVTLCDLVGVGQWNEQLQQVERVHNNDDQGAPTPLPLLDPTTALYTGQLREAGII